MSLRNSTGRSPQPQNSLTSPTLNTQALAEERPKDGLFEHAGRFVRLFSRISDGQFIVTVGLHPGGDRVVLTVLGRDGRTWRCEYTEEEVESFRGVVHNLLDWPKFFELFRKTFYDNLLEFDTTTGAVKFAIRHERQTDAMPIPPFIRHIPVTLKPVNNGDIVNETVQSMAEYLELRVGDVRSAERFEEVSRYEQQLREDANLLESEVGILRSQLAMYRSWIDEYAKESPQVIEGVQRRTDLQGWEEIVKVQLPHTILGHQVSCCATSFPTCTEDFRVSIPLLTILKSDLFESQYVHENCALQRKNNVVVPFSKTERITNLAKLGSTETAALMLFKDVFLKWDFSVFDLDASVQKCGGSALLFLGYAAFLQSQLMSKFNIDERKLLLWLTAVDRVYNSDPGPFYNGLHAADSLQALYWMLYRGKGLETMQLDKRNLLTLTLAALLQDLGRCSARRGSLPLTCVFPAGLERQHSGVALAFELMNLPHLDILDSLNHQDRCEVQKEVVHLLMSADWKSNGGDLHRIWRVVVNQPINFANPERRSVCAGMLLKAAYFNYCARSQAIHAAWATRLFKELSEHAQKDSQTPKESQIQLALINEFGIPIFRLVAEVLPAASIAGSLLGANKDFWIQQEVQ